MACIMIINLLCHIMMSEVSGYDMMREYYFLVLALLVEENTLILAWDQLEQGRSMTTAH